MLYKYIRFEEEFMNTKTRNFIIRNNNTSDILGIIKWKPQWRQYCFFPQSDCVFSIGCMNDIVEFIGTL